MSVTRGPLRYPRVPMADGERTAAGAASRRNLVLTGSAYATTFGRSRIHRQVPSDCRWATSAVAPPPVSRVVVRATSPRRRAGSCCPGAKEGRGASRSVPVAGYLAWLDLRRLGWGDDPSERILAQARVALSPGPDFGPPGKGHARLNLACAPDVLTEAIIRMASLRAN